LLAVAFKINDDNNSTASMHNQMRGNGMPAMGAGGAGSAAGASQAAASGHTVTSQLGEYWIRPNVDSVAAGKTKFVAHNAGKIPHEFMVERMPMKMDAPGQPNEDAALGMIDDLAPGESGQMTLNLKPGQYMLFCNIAGHYAAGQHTTFTVTG